MAESSAFTAEQARVARLQAGMAREGFDAVLVSNPKTFRYFTGHHPQLSLSPTRPWYLVVPVSGEPIALAPAIGVADMRAESHIQDIRAWPSPNPFDEGRSLLEAVLADVSNERGCIGLELGREMRPNMPLADLDHCRAKFGDIQWADAAELIWRLRMIKDDGEVAKMRCAIAAAQAGFAEIGDVLKPGMSEHEAARHLKRLIMDAGADDVPYLACGSGPGGYLSLTRAAGDRRLETGDIIGFDVGAVVDGYWCDFNRNFAIGAFPQQSRQILDVLEAAITTACPLCRPGATAAALREAMQAVAEASGLAPSDAGRWGHGVGLDFTEPPSLMMADDAGLLPGMIITLEPSLALPQDHQLMLVAEEMLLVTNDDPIMLTG
jgi:Xaa-Pro dipeptidase